MNEGLNLKDFDISNNFIPDAIEVPEIEEILEEEVEEEEASEETISEEEEPVEEEEEVEEEVKDDKPKVEDEVEDEEVDLNLTPLMELVNRDMPVELDIEKYDATDEESLAAFIKDAVKENSKPEFASEEVKQFNDFIVNGGNPRNYLDKIYGQVDYESMNIENNDLAQKEVLRTFLSSEFPNRDSGWVDKKIERYENSGVLEEEASDALYTLANKQEEEKSNLAENQRLTYEKRKQDYEQQLLELESSINKEDVILGKKVTDKEKKDLFIFATKRDKYGKTQYEKTMESASAGLTVLYLAYNNFNEGAFTKAAKKKTMSDIKKNLSRYNSSNQKGGNSSVRVPRSNSYNIKEEFGV